jgi:hypothetical protein
MIIKNFTISTGVSVTHKTNGVETDRIIYSEPGVRAELMLRSNDEWRTQNRPTVAQVSVQMEIDQPPDLPPSEFEDWLRDRLIEMLQDRKDEPLAEA